MKTIPISSANNYLSLELLQHLYNEEKNIFFSPFSISTAFGMLYLGARNQTADQMKEVLGYSFGHLSNDEVNKQFASVLREISDVDSNKYQLNVANKLVAQQNFDILQTYKENLKKYFETTIDSADFAHNSVAATDAINEWVKQQTHDKIVKLLSEPLSPLTRLVLLNAVYFKGIWETKFLKNETREEIFFNRGISEFKTQMMRRNGKFNFTEIPELDSKLLEFPYSGDDISLYIVLPNERQGLKSVKSKLTDFALIEKSISQLKEVDVQVTIPKFKIETSYSLKDQLSQLGMKEVFTPSADLSGIDGRKDLEVSEVIHKAVIEVNEEGSEAAAATAIVVVLTSSVTHEPKVQYFIADHPFAFFIRDNRNGMTLFAGHI
ncbi:MAG TPA: serpin family protein, partial [Ignavibacteriaceae bacterium]